MEVWLLKIAICFAALYTFCLFHLYSVQAKDPEDGAYDALETVDDELQSLYGLPGVQFEYRFEVGAGSIQCFFQKLQQDSQLHVTFEVQRLAIQCTFVSDTEFVM